MEWESRNTLCHGRSYGWHADDNRHSKELESITGRVYSYLSAFSHFFYYTNIGSGNQYIHKMRSSFHPTEDASYLVRVENRMRMKELMAKKPIGYGVGLSTGNFEPKEQMPYPPDSWLVGVWVETGIVGLILYLGIHGILFAWCSWLLMFKVRNKSLRGLVAALALYGCRLFHSGLCQRRNAVSQSIDCIYRIRTLFCRSSYRQAHQ